MSRSDEKKKISPQLEYAIMDVGLNGKNKRLYIFRTWPNKESAEYVRTDLLKIYPEDSEWHKRLRIIKHARIENIERGYC